MFSRPAAISVLLIFACATPSWAAPDQPIPNEMDIRLPAHPTTQPALRITFPLEESLDRNAAPLFAEAAGLIADRIAVHTARERDLTEEDEMVLVENRKALDKLRLAARCTQCTWDRRPSLESLGGYRDLARLAALQIRADVAAKRYTQAAQMLSSGYALAQALTADDLEVVDGITAVGISAYLNEQAIWMLQQPGLPALEFARLPALLRGLQAECKRESRTAVTQAPNPLVAAQSASILKPSHDRAQVLATRVEREFDLLRAIQALQESAASGNGVLPLILPQSLAATRPASTRPTADSTLSYTRKSPITAVIAVKLAKDDEWKQITCRITLGPPPR
jgi:hypothetical protein